MVRTSTDSTAGLNIFIIIVILSVISIVIVVVIINCHCYPSLIHCIVVASHLYLLLREFHFLLEE